MRLDAIAVERVAQRRDCLVERLPARLPVRLGRLLEPLEALAREREERIDVGVQRVGGERAERLARAARASTQRDPAEREPGAHERQRRGAHREQRAGPREHVRELLPDLPELGLGLRLHRDLRGERPEDRLAL